MHFLETQNFAFIHVPKTGGNSIRSALGIMPIDHLDAKEMFELFPRLRDRFSFAFVRNPWDRILSLHHMNIRGKAEKIPWDVSLRADIKPQTAYLYDRDHLLVDFVGRFENLQADFHVVCQKIGIETSLLPHLNATKHDHYRTYYDDEQRQFVAERYAEEIERFGYTF